MEEKYSRLGFDLYVSEASQHGLEEKPVDVWRFRLWLWVKRVIFLPDETGFSGLYCLQEGNSAKTSVPFSCR